MNNNLYSTLLDLCRTSTNTMYYKPDIHDEILESLETLVDAAIITTSWGTLQVTVLEYEGSVEFEHLISECLSISGKLEATPDFKYHCYKLLRKITKKELPLEVDTTTSKLFDCCLPYIKKLIRWNNLPREQVLTLYTCSPEKAESNETISPLFKFTPDQYKLFFSDSTPFAYYKNDLFGGPLGNIYIDTEEICVASKEQMKHYNPQKKSQRRET